jgi:membrane protein DedA with SNARE-associated domain
MTLEIFIATYGYAAIAIGTFLEGETILVLGAFAAHRGYLELQWVLLSAFLGTLFGDQLYFYIGRAKGRSFLEKRQAWKSKSEKVFLLLNKHRLLLILGFRFVYGLRTITPFILGASRIAPIYFLILNILGAFTWTLTLGILGYLFGHTIEVIIGDIKHYEMWLFIVLAAVGVVIWSVHLLSKKNSGNKSARPMK